MDIEKSKEEKLLEAVFGTEAVTGERFAEYRERVLAKASGLVAPLDSYKFVGVNADKDRLMIRYYDTATKKAGMVVLFQNNSTWDTVGSIRLPKGTSKHVLVSWLLMQFAHWQTPGVEW